MQTGSICNFTPRSKSYGHRANAQNQSKMFVWMHFCLGRNFLCITTVSQPYRDKRSLLSSNDIQATTSIRPLSPSACRTSLAPVPQDLTLILVLVLVLPCIPACVSAFWNYPQTRISRRQPDDPWRWMNPHSWLRPTCVRYTQEHSVNRKSIKAGDIRICIY